MSLKAGGVGLNLTAASNVFMMVFILHPVSPVHLSYLVVMLRFWHYILPDIIQDPWWNPAVEEQAIMRIHRIGQKREVRVRRFIVKVRRSDGISITPLLVAGRILKSQTLCLLPSFVPGYCRGADAAGPDAKAEDGFWGAHRRRDSWRSH